MDSLDRDRDKRQPAELDAPSGAAPDTTAAGSWKDRKRDEAGALPYDAGAAALQPSPAELPPEVLGQVASFGSSLGAVIAAQRTPEPALAEAVQGAAESAPVEGGKSAPDASLETLATHRDPLLGEFKVLFDVDSGFGTRASANSVQVFSGKGLVVRTPEPMPDIVLRYVSLDLKTGEVELKGEPDIGPFEEEILSNVLRQSVLKGVGGKAQNPVTGGLGQLPTTPEGKTVLFSMKGFDVLVDPATQVSAMVRSQSLWVSFSLPLVVDGPGPLNMDIASIEYNFASGQLQVVPRYSDNNAVLVLQHIGAQIGARLASDFLRRRLPPAMARPGYDPGRDPNLQDNLNLLVRGFGGSSPSAPGPQTTPATEPQTSPSGPAPTPGAPSGPAAAAPPQTLYTLDKTPFGPVSVHIEAGDRLDVTRSAEALTLSAGKGLFLRVPGADWTQNLRILQVRYENRTGKLDISATKPVGAAVTQVFEALIAGHVLPALPGEAGRALGTDQKGQPAPAAGTPETLYRIPVAGLGEALVQADPDDTVRLSKSEQAVELSAAKGLRISVVGAAWLPEACIGRVHYDLKTGDLRIDPPAERKAADVGPFAERVLRTLVLERLVAKLPGAAQAQLTPAEPPAATPLPPRLDNVLAERAVAGLGPLDVSLAKGTAVSLSASPERLSFALGSGLLVRLPEHKLALRVFALDFDTRTRQVQTKTEPPLGGYEEQLLAGVLGEFVVPRLQQYVASQDRKPNDANVVVRHLELGAFGTVDLCVEQGDALTVQQNEHEVSVSAGKGIYWLVSGQAERLVPPNRIRRVALSLTTGKVQVDADADAGPLAEHVATQLVQTLLLPKLSPELRRTLFGGQDPASALAPELPPAGDTVLHAGALGDLGYDVSVARADTFAVTSLPDGTLAFDAGGLGVLVRVPKLGIAVHLWNLTVDAKTLAVVRMHSDPPAGAAEQQILSRAAAQFVAPVVQKYLPADGGAAQTGGLRTVALFQGLRLAVAAGDALQVTREADATIVSAKDGIVIASPLLKGAAPQRIQAVRYEHGTGAVTIDLVDTRDNSVYPDQTEVAGFTEAVLSELGRQLVDPYLTPELRRLGLAGREASPPKPAAGEPEGVPWLDVRAGPLGRIRLYTAPNETLRLTASTSELFLAGSRGGVRLVLPDLGLSETFEWLRYDYRTGDLQVEGLGRLENDLLRQVVERLALAVVPGARAGAPPIGQAIDERPRDKQGRILIETEVGGKKLTVRIPQNVQLSAQLDGNRLFVGLEPPVVMDSPGALDYKLKTFEYAFATASAQIELSGDNLIAALFTGIAEKKTREALTKLVHERLPAAMCQPGYNPLDDPNRAQNLNDLVARFRKPAA